MTDAVAIERAASDGPAVRVPVVVVGAGACGLVAALTVAEAGREVLVLERDALPRGSTALSSGMIPACNTRAQRTAGVDDSAAQMAHDIRTKARGALDEAVLAAVCAQSGETIDWLGEAHGVDGEAEVLGRRDHRASVLRASLRATGRLRRP